MASPLVGATNANSRYAAAINAMPPAMGKRGPIALAGGEITQKHGLKLEQAYWTVGAYDMVTVFEAPDDEALSAHLLEIGTLGNVRTTHAPGVR